LRSIALDRRCDTSDNSRLGAGRECCVYVNRTVLDYTGLTSNEVMETDSREHGKVKCECVGRTASTVGF
jgi:hypothetical protein